jgi:hypothetical protein
MGAVANGLHSASRVAAHDSGYPSKSKKMLEAIVALLPAAPNRSSRLHAHEV